VTRWNVRECRQDEIEAVLSLWKEAESTVSVTDTLQYLYQTLVEPSALVLIAELDNRLIGTVIGTFDGWPGNIYRLAVHPDYRRQGIARALVTEVEKRFVQQGVKRVTALVEKDHPWATGFWDAVSYQQDTRMVRYVRTLSTREGTKP
jgi:ribosomal protein S18 acetylase RimI-like enzyme